MLKIYLLSILAYILCDEIKISGDVESSCVDNDKRCVFWASIGECTKSSKYMLENCRWSCKSCNYCDPSDPFCKAANIETKVTKDTNELGKPRDVKLGECIDRRPECKSFAAQGECTNTPGWMIVNCPKICNSCHLLDPKVRCNRNNLRMDTNPSYLPGSMNAMFSSLQDKFGTKYNVQVLLRDPWVVTFDNFITDEEAEALISAQTAWERSTDVGSMNEYGEVGRVLSAGRTSSNSWCNRGCEDHPKVKQLTSKIQEIVNIKSGNYESFQVLKCMCLLCIVVEYIIRINVYIIQMIWDRNMLCIMIMPRKTRTRLVGLEY